MGLQVGDVLYGVRADEALLAFEEGQSRVRDVQLTPGLVAHLLLDDVHTYDSDNAIYLAQEPVDRLSLSQDGRVFGSMIA